MLTHCAQIIAAKSKSSTFDDDFILYYLILGRSEELLSHTNEELLSHKKEELLSHKKEELLSHTTEELLSHTNEELLSHTTEELLSHKKEELLSHKKPTAQSDTSWFGHSWRAVDGDKNVTYWNSLVIYRYVFNLNLISARFKL